MVALKPNKCFHILIADDDPDDRTLCAEALQKTWNTSEVSCVQDGEQLLDYLNHREPYQACTKPDLVLLDLNMPRKNGVEALREIRANPAFRHLPIVVLTTSKEQEDIYRSYDLGVNSFITKPVTYDGLLSTMKILGKYWFEIVKLPTDAHTC